VLSARVEAHRQHCGKVVKRQAAPASGAARVGSLPPARRPSDTGKPLARGPAEAPEGVRPTKLSKVTYPDKQQSSGARGSAGTPLAVASPTTWDVAFLANAPRRKRSRVSVR
jgi:hypothetical protein